MQLNWYINIYITPYAWLCLPASCKRKYRNAQNTQKNENIQVFWEEWRHAAFVLKKRSVSNNLSASSAVDVNRTVLFESNSVRSVIAST